MTSLQLTDEQIHKNLIENTATEEKCRNLCLQLLREVQRRKLFSKYHCTSLFEYVTQILGYSESEANLRISAMWALIQTPEIEAKIESGELSLTNVAKAHRELRKEEKSGRKVSKQERLELFSSLEGQSKREAEKIISEALQPNLMLNVSGPSVTTQTLRVSEDLQKKLDRLKELFFPNDASASLEALMDQLSDFALKHKDPVAKAKRYQKRLEKKRGSEQTARTQKTFPENRQSVKVSRAIPTRNRHQNMLDSDGQCASCGATKNLEHDHVLEFSRGGSHELMNLQILCRNCNQRKAIEHFGADKIWAHSEAKKSAATAPL
jgi:5-methylcytosine-specific restriction endonuclease McrA